MARWLARSSGGWDARYELERLVIQLYEASRIDDGSSFQKNAEVWVCGVRRVQRYRRVASVSV